MRKRRTAIVRDRTSAHAAVVPTTVVVQFVEFAVNASDVCLTGATAGDVRGDHR